MSDKLRSAAQAEQEPVAWMVYTEDGQSVFVTDCPTDIQKNQRALPLYTAPPRREWVGLTQEQIEKIYYSVPLNTGNFWWDFARAIERAHGIGMEDD